MAMDLATLAYHKQVVIDYWRQTERKLQRACDVLDKLGDKIHDLKVRRDRATRDGHKPTEYSLQLSLSTLENTRNMYYEFASLKSQQMEQLWEEMQSVGITAEDLGVEPSYQDLNISDISNDDEEDLDYESDNEDTLTHESDNEDTLTPQICPLEHLLQASQLLQQLLEHLLPPCRHLN